MAFIGNTVQTQGFTPAIDYFNGNGVTVTFTLSRPIASVAQVIVAVDNVIQNPSSAFGVVGNSITFTSAPLAGTNNIWVEYTSLITTYQGISQDPTVIGDIRATGGYLAEGDFGNSFVDGNLIDYVTGAGRLTVGELDDLVFYHGGTSARSEMMRLSYAGNSTLEGKLTATGNGSFQGVYIGKGGGAVSNNTVVGLALYNNTTGSVNSAFGTYALASNTTGATNNAFGYSALGSTNTGSNNAAFGAYALTSNTTGGTNTAVGVQSLNSNTTASNNTAVGYQSLYTNTTGSDNTSVGRYNLQSNTTGYNNSSVGVNALRYNTTGYTNTAVGTSSLGSNTTGNNNAALGDSALYSNTTASNNTAVGYQAGYALTTGANNTCIGLSAGYGTPVGAPNLTTGSNNVYIGGYAAPSASANTFEIVIGYNVTGKGTGTGFINPGSGGVYQGNNSSTWLQTSDQRLKKNIVSNNTGLDVINAIQVRNFEYRLPEEVDAELKPTDAIQKSGVQLGVIAQELQAILPECVKQESTGVMSVDSDNLTWYLINAVKELKAEVDSLKAQLEAK